MNDLRVSLCQFDIEWENKRENLVFIEKNIFSLKDKTDIIILPEMFTTGFSMKSDSLSETVDGETLNTIRKWCSYLNCAICGSIIIKENNRCYNRGFFITPKQEFFYDKKHLFRMGSESKNFVPGKEQLIINYKGWNIMLQICYDLRFPVWCRNINNNYDLLIFVASWPKSRQNAWNALLKARAIENICYVAAVNRVGTDDTGNSYQGDSQIIDMKGNEIYKAFPDSVSFSTKSISLLNLKTFRDKFPVWMDADKFTFI
ncbi:MAG: amidohydrolase [Bacteroidales bacterium]|nr:amidohydrolase [Bacteroidales bacterium]